MAIRTPELSPTETDSLDLDSTIAASDRFPKAVYYIVGNEFCERFSFYGMKTILPLYLTQWLGFGENRATTLIHTFNFGAYFFTLLGMKLKI